MANSDHIPELQRLREISEHLINPELLIKVCETLPDALVVVDSNRKIVYFNTKAELIFGYSRVEVMGRPIEILLPEDRREIHVSHTAGYMKDPRMRPMGEGMVLPARNKTGETFQAEINLAPIPTVDGIFVSAVIRRTPERK